MILSRIMALACWLAVPVVAHAQSLNIDLGAAGAPGATGRLMQITALVTALSLAPSLLVMVTAFTRIIIVLSLLRSALATQGTPPNMVLIGLALFLTFFVMQPVLADAWTTGILPLTEGRVGEIEGLRLTIEPFRKFMIANLRPSDLQVFLDIAHLPPPATPDDTPWRALVPAFMVGELRRAFEMGFLLFLPFMIMDIDWIIRPLSARAPAHSVGRHQLAMISDSVELTALGRWPLRFQRYLGISLTRCGI